MPQTARAPGFAGRAGTSLKRTAGCAGVRTLACERPFRLSRNRCRKLPGARLRRPRGYIPEADCRLRRRLDACLRASVPLVAERMPQTPLARLRRAKGRSLKRTAGCAGVRGMPASTCPACRGTDAAKPRAPGFAGRAGTSLKRTAGCAGVRTLASERPFRCAGVRRGRGGGARLQWLHEGPRRFPSSRSLSPRRRSARTGSRRRHSPRRTRRSRSRSSSSAGTSPRASSRTGRPTLRVPRAPAAAPSTSPT